MGLVETEIILINPKKSDLAPVRVKALADTGSTYLVIPEHISNQLELSDFGEKEVTLADGTNKMIPYRGPVEVKFKNRMGLFGAVIMGDQVLLGAIPMEDMDLVAVPKTRTVEINPANPNYAAGLAK